MQAYLSNNDEVFCTIIFIELNSISNSTIVSSSWSYESVRFNIKKKRTKQVEL